MYSVNEWNYNMSVIYGCNYNMEKETSLRLCYAIRSLKNRQVFIICSVIEDDTRE